MKKQPRLLAVACDRDNRPTPQDFFDRCHQEFGFTVDAAADKENAKLPRYWTVDDDGLAMDWAGERVWCNPPFSELSLWLEKAIEESSRGAFVVMLVPANTDTNWFHDLILPHAEIRFLRGRLNFTGARAPFGCLLAIYGLPMKQITCPYCRTEQRAPDPRKGIEE